MTKVQTMQSQVHQNTDQWREGYLDGQRSFARDNREEYTSRLAAMGILDLPKTARILDFGSGDGALLELLSNLGFTNIVGLEPDEEIVRRTSNAERIIIGGGPDLPFADATFDAIIANAVIHHLPSEAAIRATIGQFARILRDGGLFAYVEPSATLVRTVLTSALLSPLGDMTRFSRQKKMMVLSERDTLDAWLRIEPTFAPHVLEPAGFEIRLLKRKALKTVLQAIKRPTRP